ncbi:MAG: hypothetical protein PHX82_06110 [Paracoccaceae bacterium]|nr:hypothetical protein [Paracoccaceae bacterium]
MWLVEPFDIDLDAVTSTQPEDDAPPWDAGVSYALGARVLREHRVFASMIADNLGLDPLDVDQSTDAAEWLEVGYSNARAMFDGVLANRASATRSGAPLGGDYAALGFSSDSVALLLDVPITGANCLVLFGLDAAMVQVVGVNAAGNVLLSQRVAVAGREIGNWWEYFTVPVSGARETLVFRDLPVGIVRVVIGLEGDAVRLGEVVLGREVFIGKLQVAGTTGRHVTASRYEFNDFGRLTLVKRPTRREMTYTVLAEKDHFDRLEGRLGRLTGGLVAAIGSTARVSTVVFGIMGTIEWAEQYPDFYIYAFTVKGVS